MAFITDDISINTFIGAGSSVTGDLKIAGFMRIDGDVDGNLDISGRVIIGEKARVRGNVNAQTAIIGGVVEGDIVASDGVQLFATATVLGDVITRHLKVAENCLLQGQCISVADESAYEEAVKDWQNSRAIRSAAIAASGK